MKNLSLSKHLRETILGFQTEHLISGQGRCNLGHLLQTVTGKVGAEIHRIALGSEGDWREHADAYCPNSGLPIDELIGSVLQFGVRLDDLADFERLASPRVLRWLPANKRNLDYRLRDDVILYLTTWADLVDAEVGHHMDPSVTYLVNETYTTTKASGLLLALDENPAADAPFFCPGPSTY